MTARAIHRFHLHVGAGYTDIHAAWVDDRILAVAADGDEYVEFWAEVNPMETSRPREFTVVGTGHPIPDCFEHVGTTQRTPSGLVWHLLREVRR